MFSDDDWFATVCESYLNPPVVVNGKELPAFPSNQIQANTTGQSGVDTLKEAAYVAKPLSQWRIHSSNARKRPPGELEWLEGERALVEAAEILKMTPPERDRTLLDFLRKCWKWRIEAVS